MDIAPVVNVYPSKKSDETNSKRFWVVGRHVCQLFRKKLLCERLGAL